MKIIKFAKFTTCIIAVLLSETAFAKSSPLLHAEPKNALYKRCVYRGVLNLYSPDDLLAAANVKKNCADLYEQEITSTASDGLENLSLSVSSQTIVGTIAEIKMFNNSKLHITRLCIAISQDNSNFVKLCGKSAGYVIDPKSDGSIVFLDGFPASLTSNPYWHVISVFGF